MGEEGVVLTLSFQAARGLHPNSSLETAQARYGPDIRLSVAWAPVQAPVSSVPSPEMQF